MALWQTEDYGAIADRACWAMFAVTTGMHLELLRNGSIQGNTDRMTSRQSSSDFASSAEYSMARANPGEASVWTTTSPLPV